jgi:hypothetical protein
VAELTSVVFPSAVPKLVVDEGNAGDETRRTRGAEDFAGARVDLMNLTIPVGSDPELALRPGAIR